MKQKKERRSKYNRIKRKPRLLLLLLTVVFLWIYFTNANIQTSRIEIINSALPKGFEGYKIALVADLHNKDWGSKLIQILAKEEPDMIALVGDLIDSSKMDMDLAMEFIKKAKKISPIYYVSGNHEAWSGEYASLRKSLVKEGVVVLDDEGVVLSQGGEDILLLGLQDPEFTLRGKGFSESSEMVKSKLDGLTQNYLGYKILLSHRPEFFEIYVRAGIDLALCGHAHGGQVRLPLIGGVIAPNQGFFPKYTAGVYSKDETDMLVSRGLGNSIIPIRINNRPELIILSLKN